MLNTYLYVLLYFTQSWPKNISIYATPEEDAPEVQWSMAVEQHWWNSNWRKWIVCQPSEQFYKSEELFNICHVGIFMFIRRNCTHTWPEASTPEKSTPVLRSGILRTIGIGVSWKRCSLIWVQLHVPCLNLKPELREATRCNRRRAWCGELGFALWKWSFVMPKLFVICKILHHHWHSTRAEFLQSRGCAFMNHWHRKTVILCFSTFVIPIHSETVTTYPLVNVYILQWKDPPFFMGKSTISMAIFRCYVSSPEGKSLGFSSPSQMGSSDGCRRSRLFGSKQKSVVEVGIHDSSDPGFLSPFRSIPVILIYNK